MPGPSLISDIINGILTLNSNPMPLGRDKVAPGKRQLETHTSFPEIWVRNVREDEEEITPVQVHKDSIPEETQCSRELAVTVALWLHSIQVHGFSSSVLRQYVRDEPDEGDDDTWWEEGIVRVFQPYYDIAREDLEDVEGRTTRDGDPTGRCCVKLTNGDDIVGQFKKNRLLTGVGCVTGSNMERHGLKSVKGFHRDGILQGQGRAVLVPKGMWENINCEVILEGVFNDGYLEGPVRGSDCYGNLVFVGAYRKGLPHGVCWLAKEGQGWIHGPVNDRGHFSGDDMSYVYPDLCSAISGSFSNEQLVEARATVVLEAEVDPNAIMVLTFSKPMPDSPAYTYCPSTATSIPCDWNLWDNYECATVVCKDSNVDGAGDGLWAVRSLPPQTIIAYYNGIRVQPGEEYHTTSWNYQIYVDWSNTDGSAFVDIPMECTDATIYRATLAHKANHSFTPNCQFIAVDHPRFGRIPALKTINAIEKGAELFSHYKYDIALAPRWYQNAWNRLSGEHDEEDFFPAVQE